MSQPSVWRLTRKASDTFVLAEDDGPTFLLFEGKPVPAKLGEIFASRKSAERPLVLLRASEDLQLATEPEGGWSETRIDASVAVKPEPRSRAERPDRNQSDRRGSAENERERAPRRIDPVVLLANIQRLAWHYGADSTDMLAAVESANAAGIDPREVERRVKAGLELRDRLGGLATPPPAVSPPAGTRSEARSETRPARPADVRKDGPREQQRDTQKDDRKEKRRREVRPGATTSGGTPSAPSGDVVRSLRPIDVHGAAVWQLFVATAGSLAVGVLLTEHVQLGPAANVEEALAKLNETDNCAVIGIDFDESSARKATLLTALIARVLPTSAPTKLRVIVAREEARDPRPVMARVLDGMDERRRRAIRLETRSLDLTTEPHLTIAGQLVAAWAANAPMIHPLIGPSFVTSDSHLLAATWDALAEDRMPDFEEFLGLVSHPDAAVVHGLVEASLSRVRDLVRQRPERFGLLVDQVRRELEASPARLGALGEATRWLLQTAPELEVDAPLHLAKQAADFVRASDRAEAIQVHEHAMETLSKQLFDENAHLVCEADLLRARHARKHFDIAHARKVLHRFADSEAALPGLLRHGRVLAELGRLAALDGDSAKAEALFSKAIAAFERLSSPGARRTERAAVAVDRATAALDDKNRWDEEVKKLVSEVVSLEPEAIATMRSSVVASALAGHHLLLRYLFERGSDAERAAYFSGSDPLTIADLPEASNASGTACWIDAYRAVLLLDRDADLARACFRRALASATGTDPSSRISARFIGSAASKAGVEVTFDDAAIRGLYPQAPFAGLDVAERDDALPAVRLRLLPFSFR